MKTGLFVALTLLAYVASGQHSPVNIIFDTDIGPDYDDVGALTLLHAFADAGECNLMATIACNNYPNVVPVLSVLNTYFGRPNVPVGIVTGKSMQLGVWQKWDAVIVKKYPHHLTSNADAEDAVRLYRKILAASRDGSVTIVTVGFLTNLSNLLQSPPDSLSPKTGTELIASKVKTLVAMAGAFPSGKEFNIEKDATASQFTFEHWPTPIIFTGWEIGAKIFSGLPLIRSTAISASPVKDVYEISIPQASEDSRGRKSWDQTAVLIAVQGVERFYNVVPGRIVCETDGRNTWDTHGRGHFYVTEKIPAAEVEALINKLMMHQPLSKH